jgi:AcrR family transcriptional regulator
MTQNMVDAATSPDEDEPTWRQRAVERSTRAAKLRAEQRVQRFLEAAKAVITDKGTTDFTVQEVVERSSQSLRSFYQYFDGKHELLLALFEDALCRSTAVIAAAADAKTDPADALRTAVELLFELSRPDPGAHRPLFTEFAPRLMLSHPTEVRRAHAPLLDLLTGLVAAVADVGQLRPALQPRRVAALTMETVMFTAQTSSAPYPGDLDGAAARPVTANEVWEFIAYGITKTDLGGLCGFGLSWGAQGKSHQSHPLSL